MRLTRGQRVAWLLGTVSLLLIGLGIVWVGILPGGIGREKPSENSASPTPPTRDAEADRPAARGPACPPHADSRPRVSLASGASRQHPEPVGLRGSLAMALSRADEPALRKMFADDFSGPRTRSIRRMSPWRRHSLRSSDDDPTAPPGSTSTAPASSAGCWSFAACLPELPGSSSH